MAKNSNTGQVHVRCAQREQLLRPFMAIVAYRSGDGGPSPVLHATRHDIILPVNRKSAPQLGPGVTLGREVITDVFEELTQRAGMSFMPVEVLAVSKTDTVWWSPARVERLWWKPVVKRGSDYDLLETRSAKVPLPPLVFWRKGNSMHVWACKGTERPTPATPLYHAPFANVYDMGGLCFGDVDWQGEMSHTEIEKMFFASVFTHDVGKLSRVTGYKLSFELWDELSKSKAKTFPMAKLRPINFTLERVLSGKVTQ